MSNGTTLAAYQSMLFINVFVYQWLWLRCPEIKSPAWDVSEYQRPAAIHKSYLIIIVDGVQT